MTALATKAPLASPALTGNPTAPTQTAGNNSTRLATTAFVQAAVSASAVYTGTNAAETTFPIGHMVIVDGTAIPARNAAYSVYVGASNYYQQSGSTHLAGTWRARGGFNKVGLAQRVA